MPATPKALRQSPPRTFENYILTLASSPDIGLSNIPESKFTACSPHAVFAGSPGDPGVPSPVVPFASSDNGLTVPLPIGFEFLFDGIVYKSFSVSTNGWLVLVDPALGTFNPLETFTVGNATGGVFRNDLILSTFTSNAVVIAPWFTDLKNLFDAPSSLSEQKTSRINNGFEQKPIDINKTRNHVRYTVVDSPFGRQLIVRWTSTGISSANYIIQFEVVISENGTIEFKYAPRQQKIQYAIIPEGATIGIFMPNGTYRFRDFSLGLGYRDVDRALYKYGGSTYVASYLDSLLNTYAAVPWTVNLNTGLHWPGHNNSGAAFIFAPPKNKRKILTRIEQITIDSQNIVPQPIRVGNRHTEKRVIFDDRRTINFVNATTVVSGTRGTIVNYPAKLPRFYGGSEPGTATRQDLFGDFELTASVVKGIADNFIENRIQTFLAPFSEDKLFENSPAASTDDFFTSGSSIDLFGTALKQPLKAKTHVKLSFPVEFNVSMPSNTSSIYYYNITNANWGLPENSTYFIDGSDLVPAGAVSDLAVPDADIQEFDSHTCEDFRGFGPIGNFICSGSIDRYGVSGLQTDNLINAPYSVNNVTEAMSNVYAKTITNNENYRATKNETFNLPIKQPFLIERAVIEIPVAFGDGWFKDKTKCFEPFRSTFLPYTSFDFAGPALTVALFNQSEFGKNASRRDLIMTGTVTHKFDDVNELTFSNNPPDDSTFILSPMGFKAHSAIASAVITPLSSSTKGYHYTGSAIVKSEAQASNGIMARLTFNTTNIDDVLNWFNAKEIDLADKDPSEFGGQQTIRIFSINNFGRGTTGFDPSGRSVFGKELVTSDKVTIRQRTANPFYITGANGGLTPDNRTSVLASLGLSQFNQVLDAAVAVAGHAILPLEGTLASPYLVYPGDKLTLAIAKTRPTLYANTDWSGSFGSFWSYSSGNIKHDVQLITGSINVTFYGSLLKEGVEYHDPLNQEIGSAGVHEIIAGGEPVLDQFECSYKETYSSGSYDDFIAGNMISDINFFGKHLFVTGTFLGFTNNLKATSIGTRGRLFSKNNARSDEHVPGTTPYDYNESLSYGLQPFFEKAGTVRISQHQDNEERYWDSVMPSISQCFAADGKSIIIMGPTLWSFFANSSKVDVSNTGVLFFGYDGGTSSDTSLLPHFNRTWTWAYPFEPRYSKVTREKNLNRSFVANYIANASFVNATPIPPTTVQKFFTGLVETTVGSNFGIKFFSDASIKQQNLSGFYVTSSAGFSDTIKVLYGFGDHNNQYVDTAFNTGRWGANNFPEHRQSSLGDGFLAARHAFGPIIRGWKYGVYSGLPAFNKSYFRQGTYGQFRDMLEQRQYTKFYNEKLSSTSTSAVSVRFVDVLGKTTTPERTWSQNLSIEATSSVPYFDGTIRNRPPIDPSMLNTTTISI